MSGNDNTLVGQRRTMQLLPPEQLMLAIIVGFGLAAVALAWATGRVVNWPPFLVGFFATLGLVGLGGYIRAVKDAPRIALAVIGVGVFMGFTAVSTVFIFALFPLPNPLIDQQLIAIDARLGYHWPGFVAGLADYPWLARGLGYLYHTSLPQIVVLIILLGALARDVVLHRLLLVGIVTLIVTVGIWWLWPSVGPSAYQTIPKPILAVTGLYYDDAYGAYLKQLVEVGPGRISPEVITGVVAFPSYHMVMACMVVWFSRATVLFVPALVANLAMIPATLSHGGHHLIDLAAGIVVFALGVAIAHRLIRSPDHPENRFIHHPHALFRKE